MPPWDGQRIRRWVNKIMGIGDVYNSVSSGLGKVAGSLSSFLQSSPVTYTAAATPSVMVPKGSIDPATLPTALRQLESSGGTDPNTPRNQNRSYTIPAANGNEEPRVVNYNSGYGGEYGLTPAALAQLAKSTVNKNAATSTYTKFGPPLIPGMNPAEIQKELSTPEGAGRLAAKVFLASHQGKDFTPQSLTDTYIKNYVGQGTASDTPKNRARVLSYFTSLVK